MTQNPLAAYRETRVRTASPGQLVVMLYDEAVRQCDLALVPLERAGGPKPGEIEKVNKALGKVQDIVTELQASLDFEAGGELASNLFALYVWFNSELLESNISKDGKRIRAVRSLLDELRGAWTVAAAQSPGSGRETAAAGVNIAG
ncbi:MAG: flagellar export chaperone FliS [Spirochaetia bacterium]|nr:flagellar export chaperone FliS [Spirochaetia bacterium]